MMMGGVAIVIPSTLLLLWFLNNPYHGGVGGLRPIAMERAQFAFSTRTPPFSVRS
jgi:hypothetical protein